MNNHQLRRDVLDSVSTSLCIQRICYFFLSGRHSVSAHLTSSTNKKQSYIGADAEDSDSELVALEVHSDLPGSEIYESRIGFAGTVDYADDEEREERQHGRECNNPSHNHHHGDHGHYDSAVVSRTDTEPLLFNMSDR